MSLYAIGDVQGCFTELQALLDKLKFDPTQDTLWFTGDLVNRGPDSLQTLRFVKGLGESAVSVLGNHDLHLLAVAYAKKTVKRDDTLKSILKAEDREDLLYWLRKRPLLHHDIAKSLTLIHAGLPPQWNIRMAQQHAEEVHAVLHGGDYKTLLENMYGNEPKQWLDELSGWERLRFIINCFTRLRYVTESGALSLKDKGPPGTQAKNTVPWFRAPQRQSMQGNIIFGHWSTLGFHRESNIIALDSGCLWGGKLSAIVLDLPIAESITTIVQIDCKAVRKPKI